MRQIIDHASNKFPVQHGEDSPTLFVLAICMTVFISCLHFSRVLLPRRFKSKCHSMVSIVVAMGQGC